METWKKFKSFVSLFFEKSDLTYLDFFYLGNLIPLFKEAHKKEKENNVRNIF